MDEPHRAPWLALIGVLGAICAALAARVIPGIPDILPALGGTFIAIFVLLSCSISGQPRKTTIISTASFALGGVWASFAARLGLSPLMIVVLLLAAVALFLVGVAEKRAEAARKEDEAARVAAKTDAVAAAMIRDQREATIEHLIQRITKQRLTVTGVVPWDDPENGEDVHIDLPEGFTPRMLADYTDRIQSSPTLRLPQGCVVTVVDGAYQCEAILSIMKRDCLKDHLLLDEPSAPASVNDEFDLIRAPQGHWFRVSVRIACMIVGGTTGSGKTTLLNRIIAYLARCTDALVWVVDFNGGGLGAPWTRLYEEGKADRPIVDWLADNETEAAVLMACAHEIATSRKTDREAVALKRAAGSNILPVSAGKPAIVVITDEGGEVRQAASILGQIVCDRISRLAQIGRAEAVRVIMSVLRGTADLLDKALRAVCAIRVCLRMDEEGEADHVLGRNPGRTHLLHTGSAWLYRTTKDHRPIIGRSVDVPPAVIEAHSAAVAHLRPELDKAAQRVCQNLSLTSVFDGRDPQNFPDLLDRKPLVDVTLGKAYTGRWERRKARLSAIERGEDPDSSTTSADTTSREHPATSDTPRSALSASIARLVSAKRQPTLRPHTTEEEEFAALTDCQHFALDGESPNDQPLTSPERTVVEHQEDIPESSPRTLREHLEVILADYAPNGLRAGQLEQRLTEQGTSYSRKNLFEQLKRLVERGDAVKDGDYYFSSPLV
jgi:hypothetical protein